MNSYFNEDFIKVDLQAESSMQVIDILGNLLFEAGYVKDSFIHATLEREKVYATGIQVGSRGIAIPHTDSIHVNKMAIAIGVLKDPVKFGTMGGDGELDVDLVFLMALVASESQISLLQRFSEFCEKNDEIEKICHAKTSREVLQVLNDGKHFISK